MEFLGMACFTFGTVCGFFSLVGVIDFIIKRTPLNDLLDNFVSRLSEEDDDYDEE